MGYTTYCCDSRTLRASTLGYTSASVDKIFTQQKERRIHESMSPNNLKVRECRDSDAHPNTIPIILGLDVTGSMRKIPHELVKEGLPKLMSKLIQNGAKDASLCFVAVGDHECDGYPLQVAQFESGDEELDMWLTRSYLEGGGGGNAGESYHLVWDFASNHTVTDAWEKRKQKGIIVTIGDEPVLKTLTKSASKEIYNESSNQEKTLSVDEILDKAQEKWNVYHIHIKHNNYYTDGWKKLLGENLIIVDDYTTIPDVISDIVLKNLENKPNVINEVDTTQPEEIIL